MTVDIIGEKYVRLALAINQHRPGYVDSYYGPSEWKEQEETGGSRLLTHLVEQADELAALIDQTVTIDGQRRSYLHQEVRAMQTMIRLLKGERMSLVEEVEGVYDISPVWIDEECLDLSRNKLDELLPNGESLNSRMILRSRALEVRPERLTDLCQYIVKELRQHTSKNFPLPEGEAIIMDFPNVDDPWGGFHKYQGNFQSKVMINTHCPKQAIELVSMLAHEAYPGHHTEATIKEAYLERGLGQVEHCLILGNAPSCVIQEGIAMHGIQMLMSDEEFADWLDLEIFPRAGLKGLDAHRELQINRARWELEEIYGNVAFLIHDQNASREEAQAYINRYIPELPENILAMLDFIQSPLWRAYAYTYTYGYWLLDKLFSSRGERVFWFTRLLREPLTASMVREWIN